MPDAEREEEAVERGRALGVDRGDQVGRADLGPALALQQPFLAQAEDVGRRIDQPIAEEVLDIGDAEALDIERVARGEVAQPLDALGGTDQPAGAAIIDLADLAIRERAAFGAVGGKSVSRTLRRLGEIGDNLRDDIAGELAGTPYLDVDPFEQGLGLLRRELVRERPARRAPHMP